MRKRCTHAVGPGSMVKILKASSALSSQRIADGQFHAMIYHAEAFASAERKKEA